MKDSFKYQWDKFGYLQFESENRGKPMQGHTRKVWDKICECDSLSGKVVLDIGCGPGRFIEICIVKGASFIVGIDRNTREAEDFFRKRKEARLIEGDINNMLWSVLSSYKFDCIYCIGVLNHVKHPELIIKQAFHLLRPNGWFAVAVYQKGYYNSIQVRAWRKIFKVLGFHAAYAYSWFMGMIVSWWCQRIPYLGKIINLVFPFVSLPDQKWSILDTFDSLTPEIQNTFEPIEVQRWLQDAGFKDIKHTDWGNTSFKAYKPYDTSYTN